MPACDAVPLSTVQGFHYGGCGESQNNFHTLRKCHDLCVYKNDTADGLSLGGSSAGECTFA